MKRRARFLVVSAAMAAVLAVCSCAYILHPERRGNTHGPLSSGDLVMDILWLLPGIIPGVVALAVDFSSGAIYEGGSADTGEPAQGRVAAHVPALLTPQSLELRLVDDGGTVYQRDGATLSPGGSPTVLAVALDRVALLAPDGRPRDLFLELATGEGRTARLALPMRADRSPRTPAAAAP